MRELYLNDFRDPNLFQEFCEELLSQEYPDFRPIDDTCGDEGCDGRAQHDELFFQVYYPVSGKYKERMHKIRKKMATDLKKLRAPFPKEWILVTVEKASNPVQDYCRKREKEFEGMRILIWSEPKIKSLLDKHQEFKERWIRRIYGENIQVIQPEAITYSQRNNISELLELDKRLGASLSNWELGDILKQVHTYDSTGKAKVALVPKDGSKEAVLTVNVLLRFDHTAEGEKKYNEFIESQKFGKEFEIDERFIEKASVQINDRKIHELTPSKGEKAVMKFSPVPKPPVNAYIDFFTKNKIRIHRISNLKLKVTRINNETLQLDNHSQGTEPLKFRICINTITRQNDFSMSVNAKDSDAIDGFRYATLLLNSIRSSTIKLYLNNSPNPLIFKNKSEVPIEIKNTYEYSKMLQDIQDAVGEKIPSLFSTEVSREDTETIETIYKIIKEGKLIHGRGTFSTTLDNIPVEPLRRLLNDKGISFKLTSKPIVVDLLGKKIQLGYRIIYFNGIIEDECRRVLNEAIQRGNVEGVKVIFKSREDDPPMVELYPYWLKNADDKIKEFERRRAEEAKRLLLSQTSIQK